MAEAMPPRDEMLAAFTDRDGSYDGLFVAAVRTTGIFCRRAVVMMPVPSGLVSISRSPGRAASLVSSLSGCTSPVTAMP